jgi:hypothetical protein
VRSDLVLYLGTVLSFALVVSAHVGIVLGLAFRAPRARGLVALVIAPLAPYWAMREKMRVRACAWLVGLVAYAAFRWVGRS